MNPELLARVERIAIVLAALTTVGWHAASSLPDAGSAAFGGALGLLNFRALRYLMGNVFAARGQGDSRPWAMLLGLKFGLLATVLYLALGVLSLAPVPLVTGLSSVVVAGLLASLYVAASPPVARPAPDAALTHENLG